MKFVDEISSWYEHNQRDLPWRKSNDPYVIWLSEIILQQTRVDQGLPYFHRFLEAYPTVSDFASATEEEVLKLWQGLGYYSRARNMLKTAQFVASHDQGNFPCAYDELIKLKGIGEYTAAAIASFAANEAKAVVDGNVNRVLARYFGIEEAINSSQGKKVFQKLANELLNTSNPALHNQAMMEFGALLCKPKNPNCSICPVRGGCYALQNNRISTLPLKLKTVKIRKRFFNYFVIQDAENIILKKRTESDIWANMYDFPLLESTQNIDNEQILNLPQIKKYLNHINITSISTQEKTVLTHQHIYYRFIHIKTDLNEKMLPDNWIKTNLSQLHKFPTPKIISLLINKISIL